MLGITPLVSLAHYYIYNDRDGGEGGSDEELVFLLCKAENNDGSKSYVKKNNTATVLHFKGS